MKEKIKILLIDDEEPARILIKNYLEKHDDFELVGECEDGFQGAIKIKELKPDLVILDIQMPKLNGFEMLELIDNPPRIIFSTAYDEFALKAFEFGAADYLLKPFSQKRFDKALEKIIQKISEKPHPRESFAGLFNFVSSQQDIIKRIVVKNNNDIAIILTDNIERIESQDDYVFIYTFSGERYLKNSTMNYFEQHLDPKEFVRVHRTNIIRIDRISKIEIWEKDTQIAIMKSKEKVNISRSGYQRLREVLNM